MLDYALDTNVLVRLMINDDHAQNKKAKEFVLSHCSKDSPAFISQIVLCEFIWVLRSAYSFSKKDILQFLYVMLHTQEFKIDGVDEAMHAYMAYKKGRADFSDYLIRENSKKVNCKKVLTFDRKAGKETGFIAL